MKGAMKNECSGKEKSDNSHFGHRRKSLTLVKLIDMSIPFSINRALSQ